MARRISIILAGLLAVAAGAARAQPAPAARPTGLIVGQVIDAATGRPVSGAVVTMGVWPRQATQILTGSDGRFVYRNLESGSYPLNAGKSGYLPGSAGRRRPDGPSQPIQVGEGARLGDVVIRLWKQASISGVVVDEAGEPLVGVQVRAFRRTVVSGRLRFVTSALGATDDRGMYRAAALTPGDYVVATSARDVAVPLSVARDMQASDSPARAELGVVALPGATTSIQVGESVYGLGRGAAVPPPPRGGRVWLYPTTFYPSALVLSQASVIALGSGEERDAVDLQIVPVATARVSGTVSGPDGPGQGLVVLLAPAAAGDVALAPDAPVTVSDRYG
ncbi:MAG: carboxypeptidase-like regulatory domain-containing protein, partial [Acidobacteriota bacterium]